MLRQGGLRLRHIGMVARASKALDDPHALLHVLVACSLPVSSSVSGYALDTAIRAAMDDMPTSDRHEASGGPLLLQAHIACMNARAFAARGVDSLFELAAPRSATHGKAQQILLDAYQEHLIGARQGHSAISGSIPHRVHS